MSEPSVAPQEVIDRLKDECWCGHSELRHEVGGGLWRRCRDENCHCWRFRPRIDTLTGGIDVDGTESPVCPWCGEIIEEFWDYGIKFEDESRTGVTCGSCEKNFTIRINISYDFTSEVEEAPSET